MDMEIETVLTTADGERVQAVRVGGVLLRVEVVDPDGAMRTEYEPQELDDLAAGKYTASKPYLREVLDWWARQSQGA